MSVAVNWIPRLKSTTRLFLDSRKYVTLGRAPHITSTLVRVYLRDMCPDNPTVAKYIAKHCRDCRMCALVLEHELAQIVPEELPRDPIYQLAYAVGGWNPGCAKRRDKRAKEEDRTPKCSEGTGLNRHKYCALRRIGNYFDVPKELRRVGDRP